MLNEIKRRIVYVTRDIERALGIEPCANYHIFTNESHYAKEVYEKFPHFVHLIKGEQILSTAQLLVHDDFQQFMKDGATDILVFKNNLNIENLVKERGWKILNPQADLAEKIENKISQVQWLGTLAKKYLKESKILKCGEIHYENEEIVLQWAHGHTGEGTILVKSTEELEKIKAKFSERLARITPYISGPSFTLNVITAKNTISPGNISYQITGLQSFTDGTFSTIGNDWHIPHKILTAEERKYIIDMAIEIGKKMFQSGWLGLFGIDIIKDQKNGGIYLIEINARQPASTTYESYLQQRKTRDNSIFENHIKALYGEEIGTITVITDGAQIVKRITHNDQTIDEEILNNLKKLGYNVISYENKEINSDLLRIQSEKGLMYDHNQLNKQGLEIEKILNN